MLINNVTQVPNQHIDSTDLTQQEKALWICILTHIQNEQANTPLTRGVLAKKHVEKQKTGGQATFQIGG